ncbi:MerR family transcriptional regulator [Priestia megaterium]|uniref:MerR family transcriptional regulator n=1 Tax=Priestia megaterium TaxID=1404 RepID=A0A3D8WXD7_PRIMG|nr:MerR family transcriptional regulator [Priestia megaterium]MDH3171401.1 MerR family transcriptional regulator [Priestia megaterium]RDZ11097.1 MerR family transcriptional regulator [Priestia megaterium]
MYSIGEISKLTGISAYTLRYYEKIGLLPNPYRLDGKHNGIRQYDDQNLRFIRFIYGLKQTGMKLKDIMLFAEDGCLLIQNDQDIDDIQDILHKRIELLNKHVNLLEQQMKQLENVKNLAHEKRNLYSAILNEQTS